MKYPAGLLTVAAVLILVKFFAADACAKLPHIVFIMVDDMGYGDAGCYNADSKIPTPNIDSLAREGMRFTDAHAPGPLCHLSRYGLLTGRYPFRADVRQWRVRPTIAADQMTIASLLNDHGYRSAMVGKWHLGFDHRGYDQPLAGGPIDRGFDSFFGIRASTDIPPYYYIAGDHVVSAPTDTIAPSNSEGWTRIQGKFWRGGGIAPGLELKDVLPRFTEEALKVIQGQQQANGDQPLFLYLAYPAPHTPWLPHDEFVGKSGAGMYGDFMMMVDQHVGRVIDQLERAGIIDSTLIVFTSDNGPTWYEHDVQRFGHDSSGGWRGMKADAWEAGHRMPFIVRWPGVVEPGATCDQLICFTDMLATFSEILGAELPPRGGPDSVSILPLLQGSTDPVRGSLALRSGGGMMVMRQGDWKLIDGLGSGGFSPPKRITPGPSDPAGQLYNLADDPGETKNLYAERADMVESLMRELAQIQTAEK